MSNLQYLFLADLHGSDVGVQHTPVGQDVFIQHPDIGQRLARLLQPEAVRTIMRGHADF